MWAGMVRVRSAPRARQRKHRKSLVVEEMRLPRHFVGFELKKPQQDGVLLCLGTEAPQLETVLFQRAHLELGSVRNVWVVSTEETHDFVQMCQRRVRQTRFLRFQHHGVKFLYEVGGSRFVDVLRRWRVSAWRFYNGALFLVDTVLFPAQGRIQFHGLLRNLPFQSRLDVGEQLANVRGGQASFPRDGDYCCCVDAGGQSCLARVGVHERSEALGG